MRVLFDQGTPAPLRRHFTEHTVSTAYELGWSTLKNGELLDAAESEFDVLVTVDQNLRYEQKLAGRSLAILVLPFASWPRLQRHTEAIIAAIGSLTPGAYLELELD